MPFAWLQSSYGFQQAITGIRNFQNCSLECVLIRTGRFMKSADLPDELQGSTAQILRGCGPSWLS
jgi:hypothetical protein